MSEPPGLRATISDVSARGAGNEARDSTSLAAASRAVSGARPNSRSIVAGTEERERDMQCEIGGEVAEDGGKANGMTCFPRRYGRTGSLADRGLAWAKPRRGPQTRSRSEVVHDPEPRGATASENGVVLVADQQRPF